MGISHTETIFIRKVFYTLTQYKIDGLDISALNVVFAFPFKKNIKTQVKILASCWRRRRGAPVHILLPLIILSMVTFVPAASILKRMERKARNSSVRRPLSLSSALLLLLPVHAAYNLILSQSLSLLAGSSIGPQPFEMFVIKPLRLSFKISKYHTREPLIDIYI